MRLLLFASDTSILTIRGYSTRLPVAAIYCVLDMSKEMSNLRSTGTLYGTLRRTFQQL